jgi:hypothetical protein
VLLIFASVVKTHPNEILLSGNTEISQKPLKNMVRVRGLEPLLLAEPDPKSGASANFATRATLIINDLR